MFRLNKTLVCFLLFSLVCAFVAYKIILKDYGNSDYAGNLNQDHSNLIRVSSPQTNDIMQSPFVMTGEARGSWYFEASFPVHLLDANGNEIVSTPAQAKSDWTTTDFVPFGATLTFDSPATTTGTLVLQKDNPSGDPAHDDSISIPVRFSQ